MKFIAGAFRGNQRIGAIKIKSALNIERKKRTHTQVGKSRNLNLILRQTFVAIYVVSKVQTPRMRNKEFYSIVIRNKSTHFIHSTERTPNGIYGRIKFEGSENMKIISTNIFHGLWTENAPRFSSSNPCT